MPSPGAGQAQSKLVAAVEQLRPGWQAKLAGHRNVRATRSDAAAWQVLDLLPRHLVLTAPIVAAALGLTRKGAGGALRTLADAGVLTPYSASALTGRGRPAPGLRQRGASGAGRFEPGAPLTTARARRPYCLPRWRVVVYSGAKWRLGRDPGI